MKVLENVLEELKQIGNYAITVYYGEDIGADDSDIPQEKRKIKIVMSPVGFLGSVRVLWVGTLITMQNFNFRRIPKELSNPPANKDIERNGLYVWGTEDMMMHFRKRCKETGSWSI